MADSISIQQLFQTAPEELVPVDETYLVSIKNDVIQRMAYNLVKGKSAYEVAVLSGFIGTEEEWLQSLKGADAPVLSVEERAAQLATDLYSLGQAAIVVGPKIAGTDPPQRASTTQGKVDHLISLGIPSDYILWNILGEVNENIVLSADNLISVVTLTEPLITLVGEAMAAQDLTVACVITEPLLTQVSNGTFASENLQALVVIDSLEISQIINGTFISEEMAVATVLSSPDVVQVSNGELASENMEASVAIEEPSLHDTNAVIMDAESMTVASSLTEPDITCTGGILLAENAESLTDITEPSINQVSNGELTGVATTVQVTYVEPEIVQLSNGELTGASSNISVSYAEPSITQGINGNLVSENMTLESSLTAPAISQDSNGIIASEGMTSAAALSEPDLVSGTTELTAENMTASTDVTAPVITQISNGTMTSEAMTSATQVTEPALGGVNSSPTFTQQPTFVSATNTTITISYGTSDVDGDHYKREASSNGGATWYDGTVEDETPGEGKSATFSGLTAGAYYDVRLKITPLTGDLTTVYSNMVTMYTLPAAPTLSSVTPANNQNTIAFTGAAANSWNIYWTDDGSTPTLASNKITGVTSPHVHSGLTNGTTYKYVVTAVKVSGESGVSNTGTGVPGAYPIALTDGTVVTTAPINPLTALVYSSGSLSQTASDTFQITDTTTAKNAALKFTAGTTFTHEIEITARGAVDATNIMWFALHDTAPLSNWSSTNFSNSRKIIAGFYNVSGNTGVAVYYISTGGTATFLQSNGSWSTSSYTFPLSSFTGNQRVSIQKDATNYIITLKNGDGTTVKTGTIAIASVRNGSGTDYAGIGDYLTDYTATFTFKIRQ